VCPLGKEGRSKKAMTGAGEEGGGNSAKRPGRKSECLHHKKKDPRTGRGRAEWDERRSNFLDSDGGGARTSISRTKIERVIATKRGMLVRHGGEKGGTRGQGDATSLISTHAKRDLEVPRW